MQSFKQTFSKMNLDADARNLQPGEYRKLYNGIPIKPSIDSGDENAIANFIGSSQLTNSNLEATSKVVGFLEDRSSGRAFFFVYHSGNNHSIYLYQPTVSPNIQLVFRSSLLGFSATDFVDADIINDELIFTNDKSDIKKINVAKSLAGGVYTPVAQEITLIKRPPQLPLTLSLGYDNAVNNNLLAGNYFQFFYRYVYEDYDYSVFSICSATTNSWALPTGTNVKLVSGAGNITLSAPQNIDGVGALAGDRVLVVAQTNNIENGIYIVQAGAWTRAADFPAGSSSDTTVYVTGGLKSFFNTVWRISSLNPGTVATYAYKLEGPNFITVTRPETPPATVTSIEFAVRVNGSNELFVYRIEKAGSFSSSHSYYNNVFQFTVPDSESFTFNDSVPLTCKSLRIFKNRIFCYNNKEGFNHNPTSKVTLQFVPVTKPVTKVYSVAKSGGRYSVGVMFFDFAGRHSGVRCIESITVPNTALLRYRLQVLTASISGGDIPSWATHYSIVHTKSLTSEFFLTQWTSDIYYFKRDAAGDFTYSKTLMGFQADGTMIDISSLARQKKGYTFSKGDRIKIYNIIFFDTTSEKSTVIDVEILSQESRFVITRVLNELILSTTSDDSFYFEIYTPKTTTEESYFEVGIKYPIANISVGVYQDIAGDAEIKSTILYTDTTGYNNTDPYANSYEPSTITLVEVESMNAWDDSFDKWVTQSGRGTIKSESRELQKSTYIRFGNPYIANANYLGLNTFAALNDYALPAESGNGVQLSEAGTVLVAVSDIQHTALYVGEGFVQTGNTSGFLAKTESVIGDDRQYVGDYGSAIQSSIVSRDGRVYSVDLKKGFIIRRAQDGLTRISDYGMHGYVAELCRYYREIIPASNQRIVAGWDPQYDCYVVSFFQTSGDANPYSQVTLYFHEATNGWVALNSLAPEFFGIFDTRQIQFSAGSAWIQSISANWNNWFGVQYFRELNMEPAPYASLEKIWRAFEMDSTSVYSTDGSNEDVVLLYQKEGAQLETRINYLDIKRRASGWWSSFFRSVNDVNFGSQTESKYKSPMSIRGQSAYLKIKYNGADRNPMKSITIFYEQSPFSSP